MFQWLHCCDTYLQNKSKPDFKNNWKSTIVRLTIAPVTEVPNKHSFSSKSVGICSENKKSNSMMWIKRVRKKKINYSPANSPSTELVSKDFDELTSIFSILEALMLGGDVLFLYIICFYKCPS